MSAKHTEGPWRVSTGHGQGHRIQAPSGCGQGTVAVARPVYMDRAKRLANARLIAAAPDLLAALREIHEIMEEAMHPDSAETEIDLCDLIGTASRAIAKATGEA